MASIVVIHHKRSPRVKNFLSECDQIMKMKGFHLISQNPSTYYTTVANVPLPEFTSMMKMLQSISTYTQAVQSIFHSRNMRKV